MIFIKTMLKTLTLILPALLPSWRFFDVIAPSPRIEFTLLKAPEDTPGTWQEFRLRPDRLSIGAMLGNLFWDPRRNEDLFLVSCAERLMEDQDSHSQQEIFKRIAANLTPQTPAPYLQFRLVFLARDKETIHTHITYISPVQRYDTGEDYP